jgi:hypothetical protein
VTAEFRLNIYHLYERNDVMNRKFSLLAAAVAAVGIVAFGGLVTKASAQIESFGLRVGYNSGSVTMPMSTFGNRLEWATQTPDRFTSSFGFHAGVSVDIPISEVELGGVPYILSIAPCALFVQKGGSRDRQFRSGGVPYPSKYEIVAYYLDVPVPVSFKRDFGSYAVRAEFGPYVAAGLFGEQKYYSTGANFEVTEDAFSEEGLSRVDIGVFYGVVLEFTNRYFVALRAGAGFTDENITSFYMTFGYNFSLR